MLRRPTRRSRSTDTLPTGTLPAHTLPAHALPIVALLVVTAVASGCSSDPAVRAGRSEAGTTGVDSSEGSSAADGSTTDGSGDASSDTSTGSSADGTLVAPVDPSVFSTAGVTDLIAGFGFDVSMLPGGLEPASIVGVKLNQYWYDPWFEVDRVVAWREPAPADVPGYLDEWAQRIAAATGGSPMVGRGDVDDGTHHEEYVSIGARSEPGGSWEIAVTTTIADPTADVVVTLTHETREDAVDPVTIPAELVPGFPDLSSSAPRNGTIDYRAYTGAADFGEPSYHVSGQVVCPGRGVLDAARAWAGSIDGAYTDDATANVFQLELGNGNVANFESMLDVGGDTEVRVVVERPL